MLFAMFARKSSPVVVCPTCDTKSAQWVDGPQARDLLDFTPEAMPAMPAGLDYSMPARPASIFDGAL